MMNARTLSLTWPMLAAATLIVLALGGVAGWLGSRAATEKVIHDYLLEHPEVLPLALENLRKNEDAAQLAGVKGEVQKAWPGAVLGNPNGKAVLVEFSDYACTYCRRSLADVEALITENPQLKVVIRELPILSPNSAEAAKMALAAAEQGKFAAFHRAMFDIGSPTQQTIAAAAQAAGLDLDRARKTLADPRIEAELVRNMELARELGFQGTPSWVAGDRLLNGAVGKDELAKAVAEIKS